MAMYPAGFAAGHRRHAAIVQLAAIVAVPDITAEGTARAPGAQGVPESGQTPFGTRRPLQVRRGGSAHQERRTPASRASAARRPRRCAAVGAAERPE